MSVLSLKESTRLSNLDADYAYKILRAIQLRAFVRFRLDFPDSGVALREWRLARDRACRASSCSDVDLFLFQ